MNAMPKTPEQWLEQAAPANKGGSFKLFLGYAPGVGKTYSMLSEAILSESKVLEVKVKLQIGEVASETVVVAEAPVVMGTTTGVLTPTTPSPVPQVTGGQRVAVPLRQ